MKREWDNVTVKSLVEACHISRQTFYYHFQDLMDVIEWAMDQTLHHVLEEALVNQKPEEALQIFVEFAVKNRELLKKMLDSQRREQIEGMLFATARKYLQGLLETATPRLPMNYSDKDLLLDFWAGGFTGVLLQQCRKKKQVDAKKLDGSDTENPDPVDAGSQTGEITEHLHVRRDLQNTGSVSVFLHFRNFVHTSGKKLTMERAEKNCYHKII